MIINKNFDKHEVNWWNPDYCLDYLIERVLRYHIARKQNLEIHKIN